MARSLLLVGLLVMVNLAHAAGPERGQLHEQRPPRGELVTVPFERDSLVGGLLLPRCRVDVVLVERIGNGNVAAQIVVAAEVDAVRAMRGTAVLRVSPAEARLIRNGLARGRLFLMIREP